MTDSETIFLLLLSDGLTGELLSAFKAHGRVCGSSHAIAWITSPLGLPPHGRRIDLFAARYASDDRAPTLYIGHSSPDGKADERGPAVMVLSEPLDPDAMDWREVEMSQFVTACDGAYRMEPFRPIQ